MICSGNICRSPLAECVLRHKASQRGLKGRLHIDSAGIGAWHVGESPDHRIHDLGRRNAVAITGTARQVTPHDLTQFDMLVCMDRTHRDHVLSMGADAAKVRMLLEFDASCGETEVPDPYYGEREGFDHVFQLIDSACDRLLDHLLDGADRGTTQR